MKLAFEHFDFHGVQLEPHNFQRVASHLNRQQDVRSTEVDKVEIYKCFRPGDIIKAEVISLGDSRSYFLSTAKNEYGVIFATSVAGTLMV